MWQTSINVCLINEYIDDLVEEVTLWIIAQIWNMTPVMKASQSSLPTSIEYLSSHLGFCHVDSDIM